MVDDAHTTYVTTLTITTCVFVNVIAWFAVVFGINSAVRDAAECNLLPYECC